MSISHFFQILGKPSLIIYTSFFFQIILSLEVILRLPSLSFLLLTSHFTVSTHRRCSSLTGTLSANSIDGFPRFNFPRKEDDYPCTKFRIDGFLGTQELMLTRPLAKWELPSILIKSVHFRSLGNPIFLGCY